MAAVSAVGNFEAADMMESGQQAAGVRGGASLTIKNLAFSAKLPGGEKKTILEPCSGHFEAGQLVAMMGPSGSGKTTLLDMMAMKKTAPYTGEVFVNGHAREATLFQRISAYVPQEDKMPAHWKVREALEFNAFLKRPSGVSRQATWAFIDKLLEVFGLREVADVYIGGEAVRGISGGQRRRVSLARGVAAQASLLFCDEPTSGLSATDAEACIQALRRIVHELNVLAFVVIHQPRREVAELFDTLVLLTSNPGRLTYLGPMAGAPAHFEACGFPVPGHANPMDFCLDLVTPGTATDASGSLVKAFDRERRPEVDAAVAQALAAPGATVAQLLEAARPSGDARSVRLRPYAVPFREQCWVLLRRQVWLSLRNPGAVGMQLAMPIGMGVVLGAIFQGIGHHDFGVAHVEFIFILLTMLSLQSLPLMPLLIEQRAYMKHETSERLYTESAHILTSLCATVPISLLGAACQTTIIFAMSGIAFKFYSVVMLWTLLLFLAFDALFQCVSAAAPDAQQAQIMATPWLVLFMLFNGVVVTRSTAPIYLKWIFEISPTSYALQAIVLRMGEDAGAMGQAIIETMGYRHGENSKGVIVILCMAVVFRILQVIFLKFLNKLQR